MVIVIQCPVFPRFEGFPAKIAVLGTDASAAVWLSAFGSLATRAAYAGCHVEAVAVNHAPTNHVEPESLCCSSHAGTAPNQRLVGSIPVSGSSLSQEYGKEHTLHPVLDTEPVVIDWVGSGEVECHFDARESHTHNPDRYLIPDKFVWMSDKHEDLGTGSQITVPCVPGHGQRVYVTIVDD